MADVSVTVHQLTVYFLVKGVKGQDTLAVVDSLEIVSFPGRMGSQGLKSLEVKPSQAFLLRKAPVIVEVLEVVTPIKLDPGQKPTIIQLIS